MPPLAGALLAVVLWGLSFVATRRVLQEISPVTLLIARFGIGMLVLGAHLAARRLSLPGRVDVWARLAAMGAVGIFLHQMLQACGLTLTTAVNTGWLIGLIPLWSAVLAAVVLKERFGWRQVAGLALGFAGTLLVISGGRSPLAIVALPSTRGDLLVLASTVTWAVYTILGRRTLQAIGSARATAGAMLSGWLMLVPFFLAAGGWRDFGRLTPTGWSAVLFLGIGCSGLGYLFWYAALEKIETARVASLLYLEPLVTCAAAWLVLDEPLHPATLAGGVTVLCGVALAQRARKAPAAGGGNPNEPAAGRRSEPSKVKVS